MKDALGHGSNSRGVADHMRGVDQVGRPVLPPGMISRIVKNPKGEGFTLGLNGEVPKVGYQVAIPGHKFEGDPRDIAALQAWAMNHASAIRQAGHVGGWTHPETGHVVIEPSQHIRERSKAVAAGQARNQVSIWANHRKVEIPTGGTGE
jgi:hypothetical protein